ncbi:MT-A70 family methyltransferase [Escherichia coli]
MGIELVKYGCNTFICPDNSMEPGNVPLYIGLPRIDPASQTAKLSFQEWLSEQKEKIDVDCGCVSIETLTHWMKSAYEAGNSPVTPDSWISCSDRMPEKGQNVLISVNFDSSRANSEDCLFAVKGNLPERINAGIIQSFTAPRLDHSRKPDMAREKLVQLLGDVPRIELFARHTSHGFDVWGNQCGTPSIEMVPGIVKFLEKTNERKNDVDKGITS